MAYCEMCGKEIKEDFVLCLSCEMRLLPDPDKKPKPKTRMIKIIKICIMVVSYILMVVFLISFIYISRACYKSNNFKCYNLSIVNLILFSCFCFIAAVFVGEELPKWDI